jgi:hypothetical protein
MEWTLQLTEMVNSSPCACTFGAGNSPQKGTSQHKQGGNSTKETTRAAWRPCSQEEKKHTFHCLHPGPPLLVRILLPCHLVLTKKCLLNCRTTHLAYLKSKCSCTAKEVIELRDSPGDWKKSLLPIHMIDDSFIK